MTQEYKNNIEIVDSNDAIKQLSDKYKFTRSQIERFVLGRVNGDSWEKISKGEYIVREREEEDKVSAGEGNETLKLETRIAFKSLSNNELFSELVAKKREEFSIIDISMEEQELIDKLKSIIKGEAQGEKYVKVQRKNFLGDGKMEVIEEFETIPNIPTVSEQIKATEKLHKLGFLDEKEKMKIRLEEEKIQREQGELMEEMLKIQETANKAEKMAEVVEANITLEDYDKEEEIDENEFSVEELQDF